MKGTRLITVIVIAFLGLSISLCSVSSQLADSPWPTFQGNAKHTGQSPYDTSHAGGGMKWYVNLSDDVLSSPVISQDGTIYVTTVHGILWAINPNGTIKWNFTSEGSSDCTPAIDTYGNIYFESGRSGGASPGWTLYSIYPNGTERWRFFSDSNFGNFDSPVIDAVGNIYLGTWGGLLYCINDDGVEEWNISMKGGVKNPVAIDDNGTIYVGTFGPSSIDLGALYAIAPDGYELWNHSCNNFQGPTIDDANRIYVVTEEEHFLCFSDSGNLLWDQQIPEPGFSSPAIGLDGTIYLGFHNNRVRAFRPENGQIIWTSGFVDTHGLVGVNTSPAIGSDGTIYLQFNTAVLYAFDSNGTLKWFFTPPHLDNSFTAETSSPAIGSDGTIYYGISDGYLYAIGPDSYPSAFFDVFPLVGNASTNFSFDASSSSDPEDGASLSSYVWDFGDGNTSEGMFVSHTYGQNGNYTVSLTVEDSTGKKTTTTYLLVLQNPPDESVIAQYWWLIVLAVLIAFGLALMIAYFLLGPKQNVPPPERN